MNFINEWVLSYGRFKNLYSISQPTEKELPKIPDRYQELEKLIELSAYHEDSFYILNDNKVFEGSEQNGQHKILLEPDKHTQLGAMKVTLYIEFYRELEKKNKPEEIIQSVVQSKEASN